MDRNVFRCISSAESLWNRFCVKWGQKDSDDGEMEESNKREYHHVEFEFTQKLLIIDEKLRCTSIAPSPGHNSWLSLGSLQMEQKMELQYH